MSRPKRGSPGRSLMTKNQPGSSVVGLAGAALRLRRRSGRSRRSRCRGRPSPRTAASATFVRGGSASSAAVSVDQRALWRRVDAAVVVRAATRRGGRRSTAVGYFFSSSPRITSTTSSSSSPGGLAVVVVAERRRSRGHVCSGGMSRSCSRRSPGRRPLGSRTLRHVPELAEVAAALVGRVLAPQQLARELVVEADHVGLDEALVGLEQRDAVLARSG